MPAQYDKAPSQVKRNPFKNRSLFLSGGKHLLVGAGWKKQPLTPCYVVEMFVKKLPNLATSDDSFRKQRRPPSQPLIPLTQFSPAPAASPGNLNVRNSWAARRIHCHEMKCVTKPFHSWSMSGASATQSFVQGSWALSLFPSSTRSTHQFNWLSPSSGAIVFLHDVAYEFVGGACAWTTGWSQLRKFSCKVAALQSQGFQPHGSSQHASASLICARQMHIFYLLWLVITMTLWSCNRSQ